MDLVLSINPSEMASPLQSRHVSRSPDARARARFYPEHRSSIEQRALERNRFTYPGAQKPAFTTLQLLTMPDQWPVVGGVPDSM